MVRDRAAHQIGVGGAVLETDLVDVLGGLDQRADVVVQQNRKRARLAVAHGLAALKCDGVGGPQPLGERIHDHQRKCRLLADQIDEAGVIDPHHPGVRRGRNRGGRARRAVDDGHLAEEFALAQRHDDGLAGAVELGDLDLAVEHHEQLAPGRAFLENDVIHIEFVDAFFDGHGVAAFWLVADRHVSRETRRATRHRDASAP